MGQLIDFSTRKVISSTQQLDNNILRKMRECICTNCQNNFLIPWTNPVENIKCPKCKHEEVVSYNTPRVNDLKRI